MRIPCPWRLGTLIGLIVTTAALHGGGAEAAPNNRLDRDVVPIFE